VALERVLWPPSGGRQAGSVWWRQLPCATPSARVTPVVVRMGAAPSLGGCRTNPGVGGNFDTATSCAGITPVVAPGCVLSSPLGDGGRTLSSEGNFRAATLMRESRFAPNVASDSPRVFPGRHHWIRSPESFSVLPRSERKSALRVGCVRTVPLSGGADQKDCALPRGATDQTQASEGTPAAPQAEPAPSGGA